MSICSLENLNYFESINSLDDPNDDHINLLYVAITRAKQNLVMSSRLLSVLHQAEVHVCIIIIAILSQLEDFLVIMPYRHFESPDIVYCT